MKTVLLLNACARAQSRTLRLAREVAHRLEADFTQVDLFAQNLQPLNARSLETRDAHIAENDFESEMFALAKQFAAAEEIVIAAPYWDLSFPSVLKCYTESICVHGLTFRYAPDGKVIPMCCCKRFVYVTTAGGYIGENNLGYTYIQALFSSLFGIRESAFLSAEGLDIEGTDTEKVLGKAMAQIDDVLNRFNK